MILHNDEIMVKRKVLLHAMDLEVPECGLICIKGANGTGKTLWLHQVFFNLLQSGVKARLISQTNNKIIKSLSVIENIILDFDEEQKKDIIENLKCMELSYIIESSSKTLSGGEKRIIHLLRGILVEADVYLIDEPTNDLDYQNVDRLIRILKTISKQKLVVVISHDDRIQKNSDVLYVIRNRKLEECSVYSMLSVSKNENGVIPKWEHFVKDVFLNRVFRKNFFLFFPILLSSIMLIDISIDAFQKEIITLPYIDEQRVDIFLPHVSSARLISSGAVSVSGIYETLNSSNIFSYNEIMQSVSEVEDTLSFCLDLNSTENYTIYPVEYYSLNGEFIYTFEEYVNYNTEYTSYDAYVNIQDPFHYCVESADPDQMIPIDFNNELFNSTVGHIQNLEEDFFAVYLIIILNDGYSLTSFLQDEQIQKIIGENYYIISNETIEIVNNAEKISRLKSDFIMIILCLIIGLLLEMFIIIMYLNNYRNEVCVFRNYAVSKDRISKILNKANTWKIYKSIVFFTTACVVLFFSLKATDFLIPACLMLIIFLIELGVSGMIRKKIIYCYLNKIYDWRFRC